MDSASKADGSTMAKEWPGTDCRARDCPLADGRPLRPGGAFGLDQCEPDGAETREDGIGSQTLFRQ